MSQKLIAAAIQMNSQADKAVNLAVADRLVREAAGDGSQLILLPEKYNLMGNTKDYFEAAEALTGESTTWASKLASELKIDLIAGSIVERIAGQDKLANTSVHLGPNGEIKAVYRKIHMFDVEVSGQIYRESDHEDRGTEIVATDVAGVSTGLTVCYDIRFPELYRILAVSGTLIQTVPAAFTYTTGEAHWELLLRARAVENQVFMVAANQFGFHDGDRRSYGNSMIVDPWGTVLTRASDDDESFVAAELDLAAQTAIRDKLPSLANRIPDAYSW